MQALLEGRLLGTGNIVRQLSTLGFALRFEQSALHEFDFSVGALAVDLRDGVRLCKLTEMLTGEIQQWLNMLATKFCCPPIPWRPVWVVLRQGQYKTSAQDTSF